MILNTLKKIQCTMLNILLFRGQLFSKCLNICQLIVAIYNVQFCYLEGKDNIGFFCFENVYIQSNKIKHKTPQYHTTHEELFKVIFPRSLSQALQTWVPAGNAYCEKLCTYAYIMDQDWGSFYCHHLICISWVKVGGWKIKTVTDNNSRTSLTGLMTVLCSHDTAR